jgi:MFS family permease
MDATVAAASGRRDIKILGLISVGHFMSHFFSLTLPPLFIYLREAFDVSYAELGLMMTLTYGASALVQVPVGFMVDRFGAKVVLTGGLALLSIGYGLVGLAPAFWVVILVTIIAGIGNSVFHPADYVILNSSITPSRMGRAFSIHTFAGHLGTALAPVSMILLTNWFGWRTAIISAGIFGLLVMLALLTQWNSMSADAEPKKKKKKDSGAAPGDQGAKDGLALLFSKPIVLFFLFFVTLSMTSSGINAFAVTALVNLHGMPLAVASTALTVYLFCSATGILIGGEISDRTQRHDVVAAIVFVLTAAFSLLLAWFDLPLAMLVALMAIMGLGQGITRPARDMMLRATAPKGSVGKVFGFVSAGIAVGSTLAPIPFGYLLDVGRPEWVFYLIAIFMTVALFTVLTPKEIAQQSAREAKA